MKDEIEDLDLKIDSESAVIGSLLVDNSLIDDVSNVLLEDDFLNKLNKATYLAILEMKKRNELPADPITVASRIKYENYSEGEVIAYLGQLTLCNFSSSNAKHYSILVKEKSNKRKRKKVLIEAMRLENQGEVDCVDFVKRELANIENNKSCIIEPYSSVLEKTLETLDADSNRKSKLTGIASSFKSLDDMTYGFQKGNLIILAARPSMGKTMLALNIADNIGLKERLPIIFFSLEMNKTELCKRSLSRTAEVEGENLFSGNLNEKDWEKLFKVNEYISKSKVFVNDRSNLSINEMRNYCKQVKNQFGLAAIFVDYLSLIAAEGENETLRVSRISADLKALAKDFDIPVIALAQLNREVEQREDKRPRMSDIRQSGAIEQDADLIMFLYCEEQYNPHTHKKNEAELIIAKQRNGKTGTILLTRNKNFFEFQEK